MIFHYFDVSSLVAALLKEARAEWVLQCCRPMAAPARLRTADALHLAACLRVRETGGEVVLYTRDKELKSGAADLGVPGILC